MSHPTHETWQSHRRRKAPRVRIATRRPRHGFTLVELLVVIAIVGLLVALLMPAVQAARETARHIHCSNNLKQLAIAVQTYQDVYKIIPPAGLKCGSIQGTSGFLSLMPYIEEKSLYDNWNFKFSPGNTANRELTKRPLPVHRCPSMQLDMQGSDSDCADRGSASSYAMSTGTYYRGKVDDTVIPAILEHNGAFICYGKGYLSVGIDDISSADGTSHTLLIGELAYRLSNFDDVCYPGGICQWATAYPGMAWGSTAGIFNSDFNVLEEYETFRSDHPGGVNFALVDGSVRFIHDTIDASLLNALVTREGQEVVEGF